MENLHNSTPESQTIQLGNRQRAWMDTSPKEDIQMPKMHLKKYSMTLIIRERQTQTTMMRCHLSPFRVVIINKSTNNKCWWQCEGKRSLVHCGWECRLCSTVENSMGFPQKLKNGIVFWCSDPTFCSSGCKNKGPVVPCHSLWSKTLAI